MAKLPRAVQAMEARADELLKGKTDEQPQDPEPKAETPPVEEPKPAMSAEPAEAPAQPPQDSKGEDYWERRFSTLQGIHEKEKNENEARLRERDASIEGLTEKLSGLEDRLQDALAKADASIPDAFSEFDEPVQEAMNSLIESGARKDQQIADLTRRVNEIQQSSRQAASVQEDLLSDTYFRAFESGVPDYEKINSNPAFIEYMHQPSSEGEIYGDNRSRQELLMEAHEAMDSSRVIAIYNGFKKHLNLSRSASPTPSPTPSGNPGNGDVGGDEPVTYTVAEWQKMRKQATNTRIPPDRRSALEDECVRAIAEGRVQGISPSVGGRS